MSALQLAVNPYVASPSVVRSLTFRAAQLLLADGELPRPSLMLT
jgi:hypothetical protein